MGAPSLIRSIVRKVIPRNLRYRLYFRILATPVLGRWYIASRSVLRENQVRQGTAIVIDGYPRSANSYARVAFDAANPDVKKVSSHLHSPMSIKYAVDMGTPCILLIRNPRDAAASLIQLLPGLSPKTAFDIYKDFYSDLVKLKDRVVVAQFDTVVSDFPQVLQRVNEKYGTDFNSSPSVPEHDLISRIDERASLFTIDNEGGNVVARPSDARVTADELFANLSLQERQGLARAEAVYAQLM